MDEASAVKRKEGVAEERPKIRGLIYERILKNMAERHLRLPTAVKENSIHRLGECVFG